MQRGVARGRAVQAEAHQELVQSDVDAVIVLGGRPGRVSTRDEDTADADKWRPDIFNNNGEKSIGRDTFGQKQRRKHVVQHLLLRDHAADVIAF